MIDVATIMESELVVESVVYQYRLGVVDYYVAKRGSRWSVLAAACNLMPGEQVCYVPTHANGDINHPDSEHGIVESVKVSDDGVTTVYCNYWRKRPPFDLRTVANSEGCSPANLVRHTWRI